MLHNMILYTHFQLLAEFKRINGSEETGIEDLLGDGIKKYGSSIIACYKSMKSKNKVEIDVKESTENKGKWV